MKVSFKPVHAFPFIELLAGSFATLNLKSAGRGKKGDREGWNMKVLNLGKYL